MRNRAIPGRQVFRIEDLSDPREVLPAYTIRDRVYAALTIMALPTYRRGRWVGYVMVSRDRVRFLAMHLRLTSTQVLRALHGLEDRGDIASLAHRAGMEVAA